jgi:hypothetical protein
MENLTLDKSEIVYGQVTLELLGCVILCTITYNMYKGIEIGHPIYAVIFCDLIGTLTSSLINTAILPFVDTCRYTSLANGNSIVFLAFHCCCWCVLSILRYIYIIKKAWLDEKFPDSSSLLKVSLSALVILVLWNASSGVAVAIYYGYPQIKVMDMAIEQKMKCTTIVMLNLILMISVSCWCYFQILRHNGKFGNNSVGIISGADTSEVMPNGLFVIDYFQQEMSARESIEMKTFAQIQRQAKIKKQQLEIDCAILSLKTNLSFVLILTLLYLSAIFFFQ